MPELGKAVISYDADYSKFQAKTERVKNIIAGFRARAETMFAPLKNIQMSLGLLGLGSAALGIKKFAESVKNTVQEMRMVHAEAARLGTVTYEWIALKEAAAEANISVEKIQKSMAKFGIREPRKFLETLRGKSIAELTPRLELEDAMALMGATNREFLTRYEAILKRTEKIIPDESLVRLVPPLTELRLAIEELRVGLLTRMVPTFEEILKIGTNLVDTIINWTIGRARGLTTGVFNTFLTGGLGFLGLGWLSGRGVGLANFFAKAIEGGKIFKDLIFKKFFEEIIDKFEKIEPFLLKETNFENILIKIRKAPWAKEIIKANVLLEFSNDALKFLKKAETFFLGLVTFLNKSKNILKTVGKYYIGLTAFVFSFEVLDNFLKNEVPSLHKILKPMAITAASFVGGANYIFSKLFDGLSYIFSGLGGLLNRIVAWVSGLEGYKSIIEDSFSEWTAAIAFLFREPKGVSKDEFQEELKKRKEARKVRKQAEEKEILDLFETEKKIKNTFKSLKDIFLKNNEATQKLYFSFSALNDMLSPLGIKIGEFFAPLEEFYISLKELKKLESDVAIDPGLVENIKNEVFKKMETELGLLERSPIDEFMEKMKALTEFQFPPGLDEPYYLDVLKNKLKKTLFKTLNLFTDSDAKTMARHLTELLGRGIIDREELKNILLNNENIQEEFLRSRRPGRLGAESKDVFSLFADLYKNAKDKQTLLLEQILYELQKHGVYLRGEVPVVL